MPLAPEFDTAELFARDPGLWTKAAQALYRSGMNLSTCYPRKVLTVGFEVDSNDQLKDTLGNFLSRFTTFLSATVMPFNLTESWAAANPDTPDLLSFINNTYEILSAKEQARLIRDPFFADYAAVNDGQLPHVNPAPRQQWALGDASSSTIEDDIKNKTRFMDWFNSEIMYRATPCLARTVCSYMFPERRKIHLEISTLPGHRHREGFLQAVSQ
ncbi:hypothetical protein CSAL01_12173 [Colletotrichum salicis]|uniref:Uncharacterized protein n=1 Tax=Colletotrichum salicis TaxID=1209931 RepID=A0A135T5H1_9PEZI|nr:hypothetical protein CSAL01_12173 [Colletotrichum salicis]